MGDCAGFDEIPGEVRSRRSAARIAQALLGLAVLTNVAAILFMDRPVGDWVANLDYVAVVMAFIVVTGGLGAEKHRQRETPHGRGQSGGMCSYLCAEAAGDLLAREQLIVPRVVDGFQDESVRRSHQHLAGSRTEGQQ